MAMEDSIRLITTRTQRCLAAENGDLMIKTRQGVIFKELKRRGSSCINLFLVTNHYSPIARLLHIPRRH